MNRLLGFFKAACSIGTAVIICFTISRVSEGDGDIIFFVLASLFALAATVLAFVASDLLERIKALEKVLDMYAERTWDDTPESTKECPVCHAQIDSDLESCPYCENNKFDDVYFHSDSEKEDFDTEDPDYNGTDFSGEDLVSANFDSDEQE